MEEPPPQSHPRADGPCCCYTSGLMPREQQQQISVKVRGYEVGDSHVSVCVYACVCVCDA